ncbi:MAG TPA: T9SS type A sorting domain-containing protein, partial [Flavobacteriales bacterium]|nr:T9SS type A sorting domain-containing protein [Flavobacteriales bacterium]
PGAQALVTFNNYFVPTQELTADLCTWTTMTGDASATNDTSCVSINAYVGIEELSAVNAVVAPNPASEIVRVSGLPQGKWNVSVLDAIGRVVMNTPFNQNTGTLTLDVASLPNGSYQLLFTNTDRSYRSALMVQH